MIHPSLLIHRVDVKRLSASQSGGARKLSWPSVTYSGVPCRIQPAKATAVRFWKAKDGSMVTHTVFFNSTSGYGPVDLTINSGDQLVYGSRLFEVVGPRNIDETVHHLEVDCVERVA